MSKAMIVMDMPDSCSDCRLCYPSIIPICVAKDRVILKEKLGRKQRWCPLKEVPEKKEPDSLTDSIYFEALGYNACIDEILGGSND